MSFDYLACAQVESAYTAFVNFLDEVIKFPLAVLKALKNVIKRMEATVFKSIQDLYNYIEKLLEDIINTPPLNSGPNAFCDAWLKCEFLFKSQLPASVNGQYFEPISGEFVSGAEWFKRTVCGGGFAAYYEKALNDAKTLVAEQIDILFNKAGEGFKKINELVSEARRKYTDFINAPISIYWSSFPTVWSFLGIFNWVPEDQFDPETASLLDVIDLLELFGECVFSVCDLSVTVKNKIADLKKKLQIDARTNNYVPTETDIKFQVTEKRMKLSLNNAPI